MRNKLINFGQILLERRRLLGLLQPELATISGVSIRTIQLVEQGKGNPSLETLLSLANPLGLSLELQIKETGKTTGI